jgi:flagella basal body P-ring formation protein FlgA
MDSFSKSNKRCTTGVSFLIVLSALIIAWSAAHADPAPSAQATPLALPTSSEESTSIELTREIKVQLARVVPVDLRIEDVTLGCKPPVGATLKAVAPGITSLTSRSFMIELALGDRALFCSAAMDASLQLLTAVHDLAADAPVSEADFASNWIDAFTTSPGALASFPAQGPYVTATSIRAGQPLYQNSLKRPIAVHPGDIVTVLVKNGPITVRAQLQAQSQAAVGDAATMINPGSGMPVVVTVTGSKTAELVMQ